VADRRLHEDARPDADGAKEAPVTIALIVYVAVGFVLGGLIFAVEFWFDEPRTRPRMFAIAPYLAVFWPLLLVAAVL
jgi:hypothetical protein